MIKDPRADLLQLLSEQGRLATADLLEAFPERPSAQLRADLGRLHSKGLVMLATCYQLTEAGVEAAQALARIQDLFPGRGGKGKPRGKRKGEPEPNGVDE